jgi:hypothetical protein
MDQSEQREESPKTLASMPPEIAAGIIKVKANVKRLAKDNENRYSHYSYANIDDFLAMVGPLEADAGILIIPDEMSEETIELEKVDRESGSRWLKIRWGFTLGHSSGALWGPVYRTVTVPASGAQAYGSALSYALKQFQRGLYDIPTGDNDDPDQQKPETLPASAKPKNGQPPKTTAPKQTAQTKQNATPPSGAANVPAKQSWETCETNEDRYGYMKWRISGMTSIAGMDKFDAFLTEHESALKPEHWQHLVALSTAKRAMLDGSKQGAAA